ncbi:MAG: HAD-IA family hydrolase [Deltaproteobacteria bacterium]|nr:HAD-IA family hydrolase [Deltaproteobacteria bacterium]
MIPDDVDTLIFDCDGTLVDTMPVHFEVWTEVLNENGLALSEERFYELAGVSTRAIVALLAKEQGVTVDAEAVSRAKDRRFLERDSQGAPIDVVIAIARREQGRRRMAVASGNVTDVVRRTLRGAGIESLFEAVVGADQVSRSKPAPDVFLRAAELLGRTSSGCLVYEDGDLGIEAARAAGMRWVDVRPLIAGTHRG